MGVWPVPIDRRIRLRPLAMPLLLGIAVIGLVAAAVYRSQVAAAEADQLAQLGAVTELKATGLARWLGERRANIQAASRHPDLVRTLAQGSARDLGRLPEVLRHFRLAYGFEGVRIADARGQTLASAGPAMDDAVVQKTLKQAARTNGPQQLDLHRDSAKGMAHMHLLAPITTGADRRILGTIVAEIRPDSFLYPYIRSWPLPSVSGETALVRQDGDGALYLNDLRHQDGTALTLQQPLAQAGLASTQAIAARAPLTGKGYDYRHVPVLFASRPVPDTAWFVLAKVDREEALAGLKRQSIDTAVLGGIGLGLMAILFALSWQRQRLRTAQSLLSQALALGKAQKSYFSLFDNMHEGFAHCRMIYRDGTPVDHEILMVNPAFEKVTGLKDAVGRRISELIPNYCRDNQATCEMFARVAADGEPLRWEHYFPATDRHLSFSTYRPAPGEFVSIIENVTAHRQAIADLHASEQRLRLAQNATRVGIYDLDLASGIVACDARMRELWGFGADDTVTDGAILAGIHPDDRADRQAAFARALDPAGSGEYRAEYRVILRSTGEVRDIAAQGQVLFEQGRPLRHIGTVQDISEQQRLKRALRTRRGEMESLLKQQVAAQTAAAIAHELNQPLVAISAYGEVALRTLQNTAVGDGKLTRVIEGCVAQAQRAGHTLHELLDFLHKGDTVAVALDIKELIREAVALADEDGHGGFSAQLELDPDLPPVMGNRIQVQKVLVNLLHNGIEAMHAAGVDPATIRIAARAVPGKGLAQVTVRDSGPGLDATTAARVFDPFFTTKAHGTGLGLAISRALIEAHGGLLWAAPEDKPGASFHFTLPLAP